MDSNDSPNKIESDRHISTLDSDSVNRAVERSSMDKNFILNAVEQLKGLKFPAYGSQITDYLRQNSASDENQVTKAFEQNSPTTKPNQMTHKTRTNLEVEQTNPTHKRQDYPETAATAMKNYTCDLCGQSFQTPDDLVHHQEFESKGKSSSRSVNV